MSYDFFRTNTVTARKPHTCEQCGREIGGGEQHHYSAGKSEGSFMSYREHEDCRTAWHELNFDLRQLDMYEGATFLADDEIEPVERDWLRETHPAVAARMGFEQERVA